MHVNHRHPPLLGTFVLLPQLGLGILLGLLGRVKHGGVIVVPRAVRTPVHADARKCIAAVAAGLLQELAACRDACDARA